MFFQTLNIFTPHRERSSTLHLQNHSLAYPKKVKIIENMRHSFDCLPLQKKIILFDTLCNAGIKHFELTRAEMPDAMAFFKDAKERNVRCWVLVNNIREFEKAFKNGARNFSVITPVSETYSKKILNRSSEETAQLLKTIKKCERQVKIRTHLSCSFSCIFEGKTPRGNMGILASKLSNMGCDEYVISDTFYTADIKEVIRVIKEVKNFIPKNKITVHFPGKNEQTLKNIDAALREGIRSIETTLSGLGSESSLADNPPTEILVQYLKNRNIQTEINMEKLKISIDYLKNLFFSF